MWYDLYWQWIISLHKGLEKKYWVLVLKYADNRKLLASLWFFFYGVVHYSIWMLEKYRIYLHIFTSREGEERLSLKSSRAWPNLEIGKKKHLQECYPEMSSICFFQSTYHSYGYFWAQVLISDGFSSSCVCLALSLKLWFIVNRSKLILSWEREFSYAGANCFNLAIPFLFLWVLPSFSRCPPGSM